uniref:Uncharacterized protein n=1 Tax=Magallana gigas TaxID=29159 RepID=K1QG25_MAGGI
MKAMKNDKYRLGNSCIPCEGLPITTITFGFYLLLFMMAIITNGFTNSLCTKLKVVCHFFQMVYLTFLIKIQWPVLIQKVVIGLAFVTFNSNVIPIKCLIPSISSLHIHYLEWGSSFLIVVITVLITVLVDRSLRSVIRTETDVDQNQKKWGRRLIFLRLVFFVMVMMYVPVALSVVHSSLCSGVIPANLQFFGTLFLLFFVLLIPSLTVFVSLRQRRWQLLSTISQQYRAVTWGSRKTEIHTFFEIQSTLTVGLMQALPLLLTQGVSSPTLEYLVLGCIGLTTVIGLVMIFMTPMEKDEGMQISPSEGNLGTSSQTSHRWCNKVTPLTFEEEVELNRKQLEF